MKTECLSTGSRGATLVDNYPILVYRQLIVSFMSIHGTSFMLRAAPPMAHARQKPRVLVSLSLLGSAFTWGLEAWTIFVTA